MNGNRSFSDSARVGQALEFIRSQGDVQKRCLALGLDYKMFSSIQFNSVLYEDEINLLHKLGIDTHWLLTGEGSPGLLANPDHEQDRIRELALELLDAQQTLGQMATSLLQGRISSREIEELLSATSPGFEKIRDFAKRRRL